jgi:hypothetical protein
VRRSRQKMMVSLMMTVWTTRRISVMKSNDTLS